MKSGRGVSRRDFLQGVSAAAGAAYIAGSPSVSGQAAAAPGREKLLVFRYADIKLTGGPLRNQMDRIHASYMAVDPDRLLKVYRQRAGLPAPGEDMGGWYNAEGFGAGQVLGQIISALARFYNATGDAATQTRVETLVKGFAATIAPDGYWYPSVQSSTASAAYILDKIMIGLLDAHQFAGVTSGPEILRKCVTGSLPYLPARAYERFEAPKHAVFDETYTLPENCFYAYQVTNEKEYLELGKRFLMDRTYFDPLSRGENVLPGLHAYSHVNALSSAARAYSVLGETKYLDAARNAWDMIEKTQSFASGGWAPNEEFVVPNKGLLGESLTKSHSHFETPCGSYAHLKLARYLLRFTAEARYGDGLERVLYNTVLGAKDPKGDGHVFYYSDYHPSAQKGYHRDKWPCCSGTLPQVVADYIISAYFWSADGVYVNLYTPSELSWNAGGVPVKLIQTTSYPESEESELRLILPAPTEFTVYLRIPGWLQSKAEIMVNGKDAGVAAEPRTFAAIRRRWQANDTIQVKLPFTFRMEAIDEQHPDTVALMWGPLMLVVLDPLLRLPKQITSSSSDLKKSASVPLTFEVRTDSDKLRFIPFYLVEGQTYTTYLGG